MVRTARLVVIICVTARTRIRRVRVTILVASIAIIRDCRMRPLQRIHRVMVKIGRRPRRLTVAKRTIRGKLRRLVVGVLCLLVIIRVTTRARIRRIGVISLVASIAVAGDRRMRPQ